MKNQFACNKLPTAAPPTRGMRRRIPSFSLYGEKIPGNCPADPLHIEDIQSRSRKYLWTIAAHRHVGLCQCVFLTSGTVIRELEDARGIFVGPVAILVPAGTIHAFKFRAESQGFVLTFDLASLLSQTGSPQRAPIAHMFSMPRTIDLTADGAMAARLAQIFDSLLQEFRQPDGFKSPAIGWLASAALWVLAAHPGAHADNLIPLGRDDLERLWRFRQLLERRYAQHWSVERYARVLAVSATSLNRLCRSQTGVTAFELIQRRVALEARRRLVYVPKSVAAIAAELGFKDPAYFSRFFRKHSGMSPGMFRRRQESGGKVPASG
jgi:AraC family transcriptional activator of pobA